jgi:thiamine-monophosphate kinase
MKVNQIGEFGLIELIKKRIFSKDKQVIVNIGDDAAVIKLSPNRLLIFTTDTLVEKIHFDLRYFTFEEVGWKAMAANLSDIAAMGGLPKYALVTVGLPKSVKSGEVLRLYRGMNQIAQRYDCKIIGGDTTRVPQDLFVTIALLGEVEKEKFTTRNGASKGDLICVTGNLGESQAGLEYLKKHGRSKLPLVQKHLQPYPQIREAQILVRGLKINSMIDISDGLSSELFHLAEESHLGAVIYEEKLPISPKCVKLASLLNLSPLSLALSSGEEYELLFTINKRELIKLNRIGEKVIFSIIGEMVDKRKGVSIIRKSGKVGSLKKSGFVHF